MTATLEQLLATGQVESALILRGSYSERELELIRSAYAAGIEAGKSGGVARIGAEDA